MNINLANIDFIPGQGGGGEAVIRSLDVTENGTYMAPSGVDGYNPVSVNVSGGGGSLTPEEQEALDTLVDSSEGVLNTVEIKSEGILKVSQNPSFNNQDWNNYLYDIDGEIYCKSYAELFKYNPYTLSFDLLFILSESNSSVLWKDNSGRLYSGIYYQIDIENKTVTTVNLGGEYSYSNNNDNIYKGNYGIYMLTPSRAYKFNEETQKFEVFSGTYATDYKNKYYYGNIKEYDGHIFIASGGSFYELIETEDSITITSTDPYFNTTIPSGYQFNSSNFYKFGDIYYYFVYDNKYKLVNNEWISFAEDFYYSFYNNVKIISSDSNLILRDENNRNNGFILFNLGISDYKKTFWSKISNIAVDLISDQLILGYKTFKYETNIDRLNCSTIKTNNTLDIYSGNKIKTISNNIVFSDINGKETIIKNGSKQIATVDQIFINNTFIPYGKDGDTINNIQGSNYSNYNFNTYTNRLFKKVNNDWFEFDGTSTLIPVSFISNLYGPYVCNSPNMTIAVIPNDNTYMWNDADTRFDLICSSNNIDWNGIWFDGDNFRFQNEYKLVETDSVWNWVSDPLANNVWNGNYNFGYKDGEVYAFNQGDWHLYKYNKVNCTLDKIGNLNAGKFFSYFNEMFFRVNGPDVYIIDLSKVDPQNPDVQILGDKLFSAGGDTNDFIGATDRLWYYNSNSEMCSSYQYIYETPEVPASDGTYSLKAVRAGDKITYNWVLDA